MQTEHEEINEKINSDFKLKLNSVTKEKDDEIERLRVKILQLEQQLLVSSEKHENEKEVKFNI